MLETIGNIIAIGFAVIGIGAITLAIVLALNEAWDELLSEPEE